MDAELRGNKKDWFRFASFLGWQGLYVFPQEGVLTTQPYLGTYSHACCTAQKFEPASVIFPIGEVPLCYTVLF